MMYNVIAIVLLALVVRAHPTSFAANQRIDEQSSLMHQHASLDVTTLGKSAYFPCSRSTSVQVGPGVPSILFASHPIKETGRRHDCDIFRASRRDNVQPLPNPMHLLDRRRASLAIIHGGFASAMAQQMVALADEKAKTDGEYIVGPQGLKYRDLVVGSGPVPGNGDKLALCDEPGTCGNINDRNVKIEPQKLFFFTVGTNEVLQGWNLALLGGGEYDEKDKKLVNAMPPMRVGGKRNIILPPSLAYGKDGSTRKGIPPNSELEFTIELAYIISRAPKEGPKTYNPTEEDSTVSSR